MIPVLDEKLLQEKIIEYFETYTDDERAALIQQFVKEQPILAESINFPKEDGFDEETRLDVIHVTMVLYLSILDRFRLPLIDEQEVQRAYVRIHDMLMYIRNDLQKGAFVVDSYPEPEMFRFVFDRLREWKPRMTDQQYCDLIIAMEGIVDVFAEARKRLNNHLSAER